MAVVKLTLEYDGTDFAGWAVQPGQRTVEGELRDALDRGFPGWAGLAVAGRTAAGGGAGGAGGSGVRPGRRTGEGDVGDAPARLFPGWWGLPVAGRADAGVHALAQVASAC